MATPSRQRPPMSRAKKVLLAVFTTCSLVLVGVYMRYVVVALMPNTKATFQGVGTAVKPGSGRSPKIESTPPETVGPPRPADPKP